MVPFFCVSDDLQPTKTWCADNAKVIKLSASFRNKGKNSNVVSAIVVRFVPLRVAGSSAYVRVR